MAVAKLTPRRRQWLYTRAKSLHVDGSDDNIELDDVEHYLADTHIDSRFSHSGDGCWVQAWVWVAYDEDS